MKKIIVEADCGDGDYVTTISNISEERLQKIMPMILAIKEFNCERGCSFNYPTGDVATSNGSAEEYYLKKGISKEVFDLFDDVYVPCSENGIHTIVSISLCEFTREDNLI